MPSRLPAQEVERSGDAGRTGTARRRVARGSWAAATNPDLLTYPSAELSGSQAATA
jgi:hypothetical protein